MEEILRIKVLVEEEVKITLIEAREVVDTTTTMVVHTRIILHIRISLHIRTRLIHSLEINPIELILIGLCVRIVENLDILHCIAITGWIFLTKAKIFQLN